MPAWTGSLRLLTVPASIFVLLLIAIFGPKPRFQQPGIASRTTQEELYASHGGTQISPTDKRLIRPQGPPSPRDEKSSANLLRPDVTLELATGSTFTQAQFNVPRGALVSMTFRNTSASQAQVTIQDVAQTHLLKTGQSETLIFRAPSIAKDYAFVSTYLDPTDETHGVIRVR